MGTFWLFHTDGLFTGNSATWRITNYEKQQTYIFYSVRGIHYWLSSVDTMDKNGANRQKISIPPPPLFFAPTYFGYSCAATIRLRQIKPVIEWKRKKCFPPDKIFSIILPLPKCTSDSDSQNILKKGDRNDDGRGQTEKINEAREWK
jgi:hypothetical protein